MKSKILATGVGIVLVADTTLGTMAAASAAPRGPSSQSQPLDSTDLGHLTVVTHDNNSSDHGGWAAAQIVDGAAGKLIPTSFEIQLYDVTTDQSFGDHAVQKAHGMATRTP